MVSIDPPEDVEANIQKLRKFIVTRAGHFPYYEKHPAHVTIINNTFASVYEVDKRLVQIAKSVKPFPAVIEGVHAFTEDPITKSTTLVYKLEKSKPFQDIQKKLFEYIAPLRTEDQEKWLLENNPKMPAGMKDNVKKYGFPFGPDEYIPHASIGSYPTGKHKEIWKKAQEFDKTKKWAVKSVNLYLVMDSGFRLIRSYKLGA